MSPALQQEIRERARYLAEQMEGMNASPVLLLGIIAEGPDAGDPVVACADHSPPEAIIHILRGLADMMERQLDPARTGVGRN